MFSSFITLHQFIESRRKNGNIHSYCAVFYSTLRIWMMSEVGVRMKREQEKQRRRNNETSNFSGLYEHKAAHECSIFYNLSRNWMSSFLPILIHPHNHHVIFGYVRRIGEFQIWFFNELNSFWNSVDSKKLGYV